MGKEKVLSVVLEDGTIDGVVQITNKTGNDVIILSAPRNSVEKLLALEKSNNFGVYLLISDKKVYVGQSSDLKLRIKNHLKNKAWWNRVVLLTTTSNKFSGSDIDYLESVLIGKALHNHTLDVENKKSGNKFNIQWDEKITLDNYLEDALFLLEFIGVKVFYDQDATPGGQRIHLVSQKVTLLIQRSHAIKYLKNKNIIDKNFSYSKRSDSKDLYSIDCQDSLTASDWTIVLNNHINYSFTIIKVPANVITPERLKDFNRRKDDPNRLSLKIDGITLVEKKSKFDFSKYVTQTVPYEE